RYLCYVYSFPTRRSSDLIVASCIPFLKKAKVIQIVNTNTSRVYHYIIFCLEYTSKMICISQRQRDVLVKKIPKDVFEKKTVLIRSEEHTSELQSRENLVC